MSDELLDAEPDAWGNTGDQSECQCCNGRGTYWGETCFGCGGFGWVREDASRLRMEVE